MSEPFDIYILDAAFLNEYLIEKYKSFIWTDRANGAGDFELVMSYSDSRTVPIEPGKWIAISKSHKICRCDTSSPSFSDDGELLMTYTGVSAEHMYSKRSLFPTIVPKYSWAKGIGSSVSYEKLNGVTTRTNIFANPDFSKLTDSTNSDSPPYRVSASSATVSSSSNGARITPSSTSSDSYLILNMNEHPLVAGKWYGIKTVLTVDTLLTGTLHSRALRIAAFTRAGSSSYTEFTSEPGLNIDGYEQPLQLIFQVPTGHTEKIIRLYNGATLDNGVVTYKNILFVEGNTQAEVTELLEQGYFDGSSSYLDLHPTYDLTGTLADLTEKLIKKTSLENNYNGHENLPFIWGLPPNTTGALNGYSVGPKVPDDANEQISFSMGVGSVYDAIIQSNEVCGTHFYVLRDPDTGRLYTSTYWGTDRTIGQSVAEPILFATEHGTIDSLSEVTSDRDYCNIAAVYGKYGMALVDASGNLVDNDTSDVGYDRRILIVDASSDIDYALNHPYLEPALRRRGRDALAEVRKVSVLDGEITKYTPFTYEKDYACGSLITLQSFTGTTNIMMVSEYIFSSDNEGFREYPTFTVSSTVDVHTWAGTNPNLVWSAATGTWIEQS